MFHELIADLTTTGQSNADLCYQVANFVLMMFAFSIVILVTVQVLCVSIISMTSILQMQWGIGENFPNKLAKMDL